MKKIGIVIPIYNTAIYLRQCIDSVLNQTYGDISVVLVDDGSTDGSGGICDEYARSDTRVMVIHQENQGMIKARYTGAKILDCDYITTVDSDDWIAEDTYSNLAEYMEQGYEIITYLINFVQSNGDIKTINNGNEWGEYDRQRILEKLYPTMIWDIDEVSYGISPSLCNKIFQKNIFMASIESAEKLGVDFGQDMAVFYPLIKNVKRLYITGYKSYYYRQRKNGVIPPYLKDNLFVEKTLRLCDYLKREFNFEKQMVKQIDFFFAFAMELRLNEYYGRYAINRWQDDFFQVPFFKLKKQTPIVIYGAGKVGKSYYDQLYKSEYCNQVIWVDKRYKELDDEQIKNPQIIKTFEDVQVLVAIARKEYFEEVIEYLLNLGIDSNQIIV